MSLRRPVGISDRDIDNIINGNLDEVAEIPSDTDSLFDGDSDDGFVGVSDEEVDDPPERALLEVISESEDEFDERDPQLSSDSEDDIPLSVLFGIPAAAIPLTAPDLPPNWDQTYVIEPASDFVLASGVAINISSLEETSPINVFRQVLTNDIIEHIVFQTNLYATQSGKRFVPTSRVEIESFIGMNFLMGIKQQASYRDYWSMNPLLHDTFISSLMPVNRFSWLLSHIHLNDNSLQPPRGTKDFDKLYKVRPLLNMLSNTFHECLEPQQLLAVDESMIKFKGRSSLKQYMPKKTIKRGYKVWMLCEKSGYIYKFSIYTGKVGDTVETNLGARVVKDLCCVVEGAYHQVYFDNYFTSHDLMTYLLKKKILACGTVQSNRKFLPALREDKLMRRGDYDWQASDTGISFMKWKDKRSVHLLSNFHDPKDTTTVTRTTKDGTNELVPCPTALKDYNNHMNNVDKFDQLKKYYEVDRKSKKWWHRILFHFLDVCVVNSHILLKIMEPTQPLKQFKLAVITSLTAERLIELKTTNKRGRPVDEYQLPVSVRNHKPYVPHDIRYQQAAHQPVRASSRRCARCSMSNHQRRTKWMCDTCHVPLCLGPNKTCFKEHHSKGV